MIRITFFENGNTMAFNDNGQQVPELQQPWFKAYVENVVMAQPEFAGQTIMFESGSRILEAHIEKHDDKPVFVKWSVH